jgi:hypothetical protein
MTACAQCRVKIDAVRANVEELKGLAEEDGDVRMSEFGIRGSGFGWFEVIVIIHRLSFLPCSSESAHPESVVFFL